MCTAQKIWTLSEYFFIVQILILRPFLLLGEIVFLSPSQGKKTKKRGAFFFFFWILFCFLLQSLVTFLSQSFGKKTLFPQKFVIIKILNSWKRKKLWINFWPVDTKKNFLFLLEKTFFFRWPGLRPYGPPKKNILTNKKIKFFFGINSQQVRNCSKASFFSNYSRSL